MTDSGASDTVDARALAHLLGRLVAVVRLGTTATCRDVGPLPSRQVATLQVLLVTGPARVSDLARRVGVSNPTMTGILDRLEARGLVRRTRDRRDRRVTVVEITDVGTALVQGGSETVLLLERALGRLTPEDRCEIAHSLATLTAVLTVELVSTTGLPSLGLTQATEGGTPEPD